MKAFVETPLCALGLIQFAPQDTPLDLLRSISKQELRIAFDDKQAVENALEGNTANAEFFLNYNGILEPIPWNEPFSNLSPDILAYFDADEADFGPEYPSFFIRTGEEQKDADLTAICLENAEQAMLRVRIDTGHGLSYAVAFLTEDGYAICADVPFRGPIQSVSVRTFVPRVMDKDAVWHPGHIVRVCEGFAFLKVESDLSTQPLRIMETRNGEVAVFNFHDTMSQCCCCLSAWKGRLYNSWLLSRGATNVPLGSPVLTADGSCVIGIVGTKYEIEKTASDLLYVYPGEKIQTALDSIRSESHAEVVSQKIQIYGIAEDDTLVVEDIKLSDSPREMLMKLCKNEEYRSKYQLPEQFAFGAQDFCTLILDLDQPLNEVLNNQELELIMNVEALADDEEEEEPGEDTGFAVAQSIERLLRFEGIEYRFDEDRFSRTGVFSLFQDLKLYIRGTDGAARFVLREPVAKDSRRHKKAVNSLRKSLGDDFEISAVSSSSRSIAIQILPCDPLVAHIAAILHGVVTIKEWLGKQGELT